MSHGTEAQCASCQPEHSQEEPSQLAKPLDQLPLLRALGKGAKSIQPHCKGLVSLVGLDQCLALSLLQLEKAPLWDATKCVGMEDARTAAKGDRCCEL